MNSPLEIFASIIEELEQHPEHWCQGSIALTAGGQLVPSLYQHAVQWCIVGHINKRADDKIIQRRCYNLIQDKIDTINIPKWNDAKDHTVEDVINLCKELTDASQV